MILTWVICLLIVCSTLIVSLERLATLHVIQTKTIEQAQERFIASEKSIIECESSITNLSALEINNCFIQSVGKNRWLISSKEKPIIQVHVFVDERTGLVTRLNWRQVFE
jgi:predicted DNA-binding ArsR family transcriptional regulator